MISRCGFLVARRDIPRSEFSRIWREVHAPIALRAPGLRRYVQNHVVDSSTPVRDHANVGGAGGGGVDAYDGISELQFDDVETMTQGMAAVADVAAVDLATFVERTDLVIFTKNRLRPRPIPGAGVKAVIVATRSPAFPLHAFHEYWMHRRAALWSRTTGVVSSTQAIAIDRRVGSRSVPRALLPIDALDEVWFQDARTMRAAMATTDRDGSMVHQETVYAADELLLRDDD